MSDEQKQEKKEINFGVESQDRREGAAGSAKGPNGGVIVTGVARFSSSAKAGIQIEDEIISIGGKTAATLEELTAAVAAAGVGATVKLGVFRAGEKMEVKVRLFAKKTLKNFKVSKADVVLERKIAP